MKCVKWKLHTYAWGDNWKERCGKPGIGIDEHGRVLCSKHMRKHIEKTKYGAFERCQLFGKRLII